MYEENDTRFRFTSLLLVFSHTCAVRAVGSIIDGLLESPLTAAEIVSRLWRYVTLGRWGEDKGRI